MRQFLLVVFVIVSWAATAQSAKEVKVTAACDGYFQFKVSNDLLGATVEVFDEGNQLVGTQPIRAKRTTLDFFDATAGIYRIVIKAEDYQTSYRYVLCESRVQYLAIVNPLPAQPSLAGK